MADVEGWFLDGWVGAIVLTYQDAPARVAHTCVRVRVGNAHRHPIRLGDVPSIHGLRIPR